ncbi:MAG TPA: PQQ-binding-like beta-propeller repeat protein [Pirellulales bacterium]|nr:PQQ-binding-like beta-propeller repeat protein [Pirellulales bacterium]
MPFLWLAVALVVPAASAQAQWVPQAQVQFGRQHSGQPGDETVDGPFQPPNHETSRHLEQAKKLLDDGHYSDGLQLLDDIMQKNEDYFLPPGPGQSSHRGLKQEVQRLISEQPLEGLKAYETLFGAKAQRMLSDALSTNDIDGIGQVARRYFNTKAGNDATLLVGLWDLDHNQPLAAALCLERLHDVATGASYEPSLSVLLAYGWLQGGQQQRAMEVLKDLKRKFPGATIRIGDRSVRLFSDDTQAIAWLTETMGKDRPSQGMQLVDWTIFRGDPSRNASSAGGTPLLDLHWRVLTTDNQPSVVSARKANLDNNIPIMPVMQPLAVADVVLMRTARGLLAIDFNTGKLVWEVRSATDAQADAANGQRNGVPQQGDPSLAERLWENATLGTLASDGKYVFMVEDPKPDNMVTEQQRVMVRQFGMWRQPAENVTNQLAAYELKTQGKIKWRVGGGDRRDFEIEPKLAGAYFLGPPLPLDGQLYVLAELQRQITLVVLDAKTGKLEWQQQLVSTEDSNTNGFQDSYRRLTGATPSFADGVLVCPTSAGAVVAVDLATHKLLWGYEYPPGPMDQNQQIMAMRFNMMNGGGLSVPSYAGNRWADSTATIADGHVLITPVEGEQPLFCLSLIDGKLSWRMDRGENVYVAGVQDGKVILVGKRKVQAVSLVDTIPGTTKDASPTPKPIWSVDLDPARVAGADGSTMAAVGAMPSGRGFLSGGKYFLPLSTAEVVCIDIAQGKLVDRTRSRKGDIPGNLICYKNHVISLGVEALCDFYQLEPLRAQIAAALQKNPDDVVHLALRGDIELNAGQVTNAIRDIRRAYDTDREDKDRAYSRPLLVDAMLAALRKDFNGSRMSIDELEKLISLDSEQAEFLRMLAEGLQKSKGSDDRLAAVDAYLKLADLKWGQSEPESIEPNLSVRRDRWVEARMESLYSTAPAADRAKIDAILAARVKAIVAGKNDADLRAYDHYFGFHPTADLARAELVRQLTGNESILERQLLFSKLEASEDPAMRRAATAQLAELLRMSNADEAAIYYRRLKTEFADQVCLDGKTGKQIVDELPPDSPEAHVLAESSRWPTGAVKHDGGRNAQGMNFQRPMPLAWRGDRGPFFQNTTILFDPQQQIVGRDGMGREKFRIPLNENGQNRFGYQINGATAFVSAKGHLLFVDLGNQVVALDTLRPMNSTGRVLWQQELFELAMNVFNGQVQMRQVQLPWGQVRQTPQATEQATLGVVGPITDRCVCVARSRDLLALDPLTGATLWTWHGLLPGAEIFGDDDAIIIAPQDGSDATVLRTTDGQQLGHCNVPPIDHRAGYHGRRVLTWRTVDGSSNKIEIRLADCWKGQDIVLGEFSEGMKGTVVDDESLAILEPSGHFRILALDDGRKLVDDQIDLEKRADGSVDLVEIIVQATPDQYVLIAKRREADPSQMGNPQYMPMPGFDAGLQLVSGSVFAFNRSSGKQSWSVPALVDHEYVVLDQGQELPVILFVHMPPRMPQRGGEASGSVLCLDRRTGRAVLNEDVMLQPNIYHFSMTGDRQANTVSVNVSTRTFTLQLTDEPVPPEPPYQSRLSKLKAPLMGTTTDAILKALQSAAGGAESDDDSDGR